MDNHTQLAEHGIPRLLVRFSIPAITGMLVNALYNVVDRIFIGQGVGSLALAGATIGFPLMLVGMGFVMLIGLGATAVISISLGERRREYAERVFANALVLLLGVSILLTITGLAFLEPMLRLFGASDAIMVHARAYMEIILLGTPFMAVGFGLNHMIRGEGNPRMAMVTMLIGAVLNTILDPVFIFGFGMGVRGAAIATIISQFVTAVWVLAYFLGGKSHLRFRLANLRLSSEAMKRILTVGSAPFAMQLASSVLNGILNNRLQRYGGDTAISAMGIVYGIMTLLLMPLFGLNQGAQPIIGFNYGARNYDRVKKTVLLAAGSATVYVLAGFALVQLFPRTLVMLFNTTDEALMSLGTHALRVFFLLLPLIGFQIISANYFQAVGKPRHAMFLSLSRQVLVLIPLLLILPPIFGLDGIWAAAPVSDFVSSVLTGLFLFREMRKLGRDHEAEIVTRASRRTEEVESPGTGGAADPKEPPRAEAG
jgi:putative MATE family efflux protein